MVGVSAGADRWLRVATELAGGEGTPDLHALCGRCAQLLGAAGVGVAVMGADAAPGAAYASSSAIGRLEELQFLVGVGPRVDAHEQGVPVMENDLVTAPPRRWTPLVPAALEAGIRAVFAFPLQVGAARVGALTVYLDRSGPLEDDVYADALVAAGFVTRAILAIQAGAPEGALAAELADDSVDHVQVHQAAGMISAQLDIGIGEALVRLRARAFAEGTSLSEVADDVVARRLRFQP